jgi:hypothetical protein
MHILFWVPGGWIEDILVMIKVKLAEVYPTTFNTAEDYGEISWATRQEVRRLVSLEKALKKIDLLPPLCDMPWRTDGEIDSKFLAWQEEAKTIAMRIVWGNNI